MQRYQWPGYEMQLLRELQRQQNNAQFCDTMLQTEGISVPTHSCILAALSPYLSQKLSASPPPPYGQMRQLQLQAVKAQTLLKLVGLLYSGEVEVKGSIEQNDVLSAARQFGITDLVEGQSFSISLNDDSNSLTPQEDSSHLQSSEFGDRVGTGLDDEKTNAKTAETREDTEQRSHANRDEIPGEEQGNSTEKHACANVGMKSLAKMKQMQKMIMKETTQISIKVKLRRRTKGEVWEVVSMQDADDTLSVLSSMKQTDRTNGEPSSVQPGQLHKPETLILQSATANSPEPPPHPSNTPDSQLLCGDCLNPNHNHDVESVPLPQSQGPAEESEEQIEKLLEDIMMGLNILPNLKRDCKKSHHLQPGHDGAPAMCQVPVTEDERAHSQMHAPVGAAGCVYNQDFGTQIGHSSASTVIIPNPQPNTSHLSFVNSRWIDSSLLTCCTGIHCCFTAQRQPSCSSLLLAHSDAVLIQQHQQRSPQYHSSMWQRDGTSHQSTPLSKSLNCPYPEAPTVRSVIPTSLYSSGQKPHYLEHQEPSSQGDQNILEFLPMMNEAESLRFFSLPCVDDMRLPRCLSPLEPFASAAKCQPILNNSTDQGEKIQPQPSQNGRSWLTENPGSLQFPLSAITHRENKSVYLPQDTNHSCWRWQKHPENPQNRGTWAESVSEVKSDQSKMKECLKWKQSDTKGDAAEPKRRKRKHTSHPQNAAGSLLAYDVKVSDGTKSQINLSVCSVSLSSNNVLAKEREMATSALNIPNKFIGIPDEPSAITESSREKTRGAGDLSIDQTRIRTRSFLKKTQETPSDTSLENYLVLKPVACRAKILNKQGVSPVRRKRGRPRKAKLEESYPAISGNNSHGAESEQQIDNNLPKEKEEGDKTKRRHKRRRRTRSEREVIAVKKAKSAETAGKAEADDNDDRKLDAPKRQRMVTLKEIQKLIKRQHSKTRKSKESEDKETNETARDVGGEAKACGSRCEKLFKGTELDIDISQPQNGDRIEEPCVNVTVDKNHNQIFNKSTAEYSKSRRDDTNSSTSETSLLSEEYHPVFSFDVLGEEVAKLGAEREQAPRSSDEALKASDAVSDTTQQTTINDEGSSHSDTHTALQEDKMPLDSSVNPQTAERTHPPLSGAVGFIRSSGCNREEEEEEEEVEVDVLFYSPDKVAQSRECENRLDNMNISPEEEEEEDVNEIDVTGDEAE
ncbi:uncharacterized protein LOC127354188 isoform X2 [Dicentrarchus labrax]|uniref:uncharacterized protein LOC127354188 isoform X2 n=1 Tax=Dicentrarchus labrax TaxID=13489 RepID=UPI0021F5B526|nr:uncharacterized protein LOC127354188 isoform X2 [Dicentrarchus labrax]